MQREHDWNSLHSGLLTRPEIMQAIAYPDWQRYRLSLTGHSLDWKFRALRWWLDRPAEIPLRVRQVQVTNYINALRRGGQIK